MADLSKTIKIIFDGVDSTGNAFQAVSDKIDGFSDSVSNVTEPLSDFADKLILAEGAALVFGATIAGIAIKEAGQFNEAIAETGTLFNATSEQTDYLSERVREFSSTSTSNIATINESMYNAISATGDWENAHILLAQAEQLGVAGASNLGTATSALTTVMGAYGDKAGTAEEVSDALFVTVQNGKTTLNELEGSIGRVATIAATSNVNVDTLGAAMSALTVATGNTSESATLFASLLKELSKPGDELREVMGKLNVETDGLAPILQVLGEKTGWSQAKMNGLFGSVEAATGALILGKDASGIFGTALDAMTEKTGRTAAAYQAMADKFSNVNQILANNISLSFIALGTDLQDGYTDVVQSLSNVFRGLTFSIDDGAFDTITGYLNEKAEKLSELFQGIAKALPQALEDVDFTGLIAAFNQLLNSVGSVVGAFLGESFDPTKPKELAEILQLMVDGFTKLTEVVSGIIVTWESAAGALGSVTRASIEMDSGNTDLIATVLSLSQQFEFFKGGLDLVSGSLSLAGDAMILIAGAKYLGLLSGAFTAITAIVTAAALPFTVFVGVVTGVVLGYRHLSEELDLSGEKFEANLRVVDENVAMMLAQERALDRVRTTTGVNVQTMDELAEALRNGTLVYDELKGRLVNTNSALYDHKTELTENETALRAMVDLEREFEEAMETEARNIRDSEIAMRDRAATAEHTANMQRGYTQSIIDGVTTLTQYGGVLAGTKPKIDNTAESLSEAKKKADEMALAWAELASSEREVIFSAAADIQVAEIEADAERVIAYMESLSSSFENTGDVLSGLFELWGETSRFDQSEIGDWIDREYAMREQLAEAQLELTRAEIERIREQTAMLERGGVELRITSDGLEPELEAFMFKVIDKIRVNVAGTYEEFLIGAGCGA